MFYFRVHFFPTFFYSKCCDFKLCDGCNRVDPEDLSFFAVGLFEKSFTITLRWTYNFTNSSSNCTPVRGTTGKLNVAIQSNCPSRCTGYFWIYLGFGSRIYRPCCHCHQSACHLVTNNWYSNKCNSQPIREFRPSFVKWIFTKFSSNEQRNVLAESDNYHFLACNSHWPISSLQKWPFDS